MKYDPAAIEQARKREGERYHNDPMRRDRYAFEWFMKAEDARYWQLTVEYVNHARKRATAIAITCAVFAAFASAVFTVYVCAWLR